MNKFIRLLFSAILLLNLTASLFAFESGEASWYGGKFQGRKTANGEIFDTNLLTAAHKTLPFNTIVKVTNLNNNRSVNVRINDRGPFVKGRVIDLSHAAAERIDITVTGIALVKLEILSLPDGVSESGLKKTESVHPEGIPDSYTIQIASFSGADNAQNCLNRVTKAGIHAVLEISDSGMLRIIIPEVKKEELINMKDQLSGIGFTSPLIRNN
jgi:rare lipoprotein A